MSESTRAVFTISGRVEARELGGVLSLALSAARAAPDEPVYLDCGGVVSFTGDALLMLAWACHRCEAAGATVRLVEFPSQIMATVTDRLTEAITRRMAGAPAAGPRRRWDGAYSVN
ncbi:hypothetical protein R5W23_001218 [Gemmata sp. JC673]|uniref:STAS domain-containing protein n=1 Tax=Gemmata algarum TaxID=2975278 RepID=A0ABU5EXW3_9BACT|nr:hypothetical protein [Gemmata algarum]MDY3560011.1 hypothetical protein [Gemmata algarum]